MKTSIKEYLQEHDKAQINDLAAALGKEGSKDFRDLVKTISLMERRHELKFEDDGSLRLAQKKAPAITLKGIFHAHKNGFGFVSLEGEEEDLFVGRNDVNHAIDGDTVEIVITKVADRNKGTAAEAKIIDVLEHSIKTVVGQIVLDEEKPKYAGYIRSKNQKISQLWKGQEITIKYFTDGYYENVAGVLDAVDSINKELRIYTGFINDTGKELPTIIAFEDILEIGVKMT